MHKDSFLAALPADKQLLLVNYAAEFYAAWPEWSHYYRVENTRYFTLEREAYNRLQSLLAGLHIGDLKTMALGESALFYLRKHTECPIPQAWGMALGYLSVPWILLNKPRHFKKIGNRDCNGNLRPIFSDRKLIQLQQRVNQKSQSSSSVSSDLPIT